MHITIIIILINDDIQIIPVKTKKQTNNVVIVQ